MKLRALISILLASAAFAADPPEPKFTAVTLDDKIQIGYGLAIADVDGDKLPDVLLADKKQFVWYRNPGPEKARDAAAWKKFLIAENLTEHDDVCIAAQDIDGDGKCEIAVGAEWNPGDTEKSGAVFYLIPPADRTQPWTPVKFPSVEPTTHRMKWLRLGEKEWGLVVVPLHGRGNKNGEGAPVKVLLYHPPAPLNDPKGEWKSEVVDESMHMTHNFAIHGDGLMLIGEEGFGIRGKHEGKWANLFGDEINQAIEPSFKGAGEIRYGAVAGDVPPYFFGTVEPMHGSTLVIYWYPDNHAGNKVRRVLTDKLIEGHALACGDLLGVKSDQIVVGWRGNPSNPNNNFGIHLWTPLDATGEKWRDSAVDDGGMACEDLQLADLDGDGRPDIIASGRATKNVKLYFNDTTR
jgi:hypothetical protein